MFSFVRFFFYLRRPFIYRVFLTNLLFASISRTRHHMDRKVVLSLVTITIAVTLHSRYISHLSRQEPRSAVWIPRKGSRVVSVMGGAEAPVLSVLRRSFSAEADRVAHALKVSLAGAGFVELEKPTGVTTVDALNTQFRYNISTKTLVSTPNSLVRSVHPARRAILLSPVSDGIVDVVSHCRRKVQHARDSRSSFPACDDPDVVQCVGTVEAVSEIERARWAHREHEDDDTYINIPLSPRHPKVSTLALRSVFKDALPLIFDHPTSDNESSSDDNCDAFADTLLDAYSKSMQPLEQQIDDLRQRLLIIAGFPVDVDKRIDIPISPSDLLDAAEGIAQLV